MTKPLHPATVHFPVAFVMLGTLLDVVHLARPSVLPASAHEVTRATYYLLSLGLLTSLPAVVTGGFEAMRMIQKQGMYEPSGARNSATGGSVSVLRPKVKATIVHALANDIVIAVNTYVWWVRRDNAHAALPGSAGRSYAPEPWMVVAQGLVLCLMLFGANVGGALTYNYGVGFSSAYSAAATGGNAKKAM